MEAWNKTANIHPENGREIIARDCSKVEFRGIFRQFGTQTNSIPYVGNRHICVFPEWKYAD